MFRWIPSALPARLPLFLAAASASLLASPMHAQIRDLDWDYVITTPDITTDVHGTTADDRTPVRGQPGQTFAVAIDLGPLTSNVAVDAHDRVDGGIELFSVEQTTELPGGLTVDPADVVQWDGAAHSLAFDASAFGLDGSANVDAVSKARFGSQLYLSFDSTVSLGGVTAADEDLVEWDGTTVFSLFFDGSDRGVDPALDVDGADYVEGDEGDWVVVSFDGDGEVPEDLFVQNPWPLGFDPSDVMLYDTTEQQWDYVHWPGFENDAADTQTVSAMTVTLPEPMTATGFAAGALLLATLARRSGPTRA